MIHSSALKTHGKDLCRKLASLTRALFSKRNVSRISSVRKRGVSSFLLFAGHYKCTEISYLWKDLTMLMSRGIANFFNVQETFYSLGFLGFIWVMRHYTRSSSRSSSVVARIVWVRFCVAKKRGPLPARV